MVESLPAAAGVGDAYRCRIVDSMYRDPETWDGDYQPGFSAAVIARAIREAGRQAGIPSPGAFIAMCIRQREQFRFWNGDNEKLLELRYQAEDYLEQFQPQRLALTHVGSDAADDEDDWEIPF
jgi:hypothetical protein